MRLVRESAQPFRLNIEISVDIAEITEGIADVRFSRRPPAQVLHLVEFVEIKNSSNPTLLVLCHRGLKISIVL